MLSGQGHPKAGLDLLDIRKRIGEFYSNLNGLVAPSISYKILEIAKIESEAIMVNGERIEGYLLSMLFKDCQ